MALDYANQVSMGLVAKTHAQWLRDHPDWEEVDENGEADAELYGMAVMANAFLRAYYELIAAGICEPLHKLQRTEEGMN